MSRYERGWGGEWDRTPQGRPFGSPGQPRGGSPGASGGDRFRERGGGPSPQGGEWLYGESVYGPERYGLGPYYERLRRRRRPDDELAKAVEEALFFDSWIDADAITVEVRDGVVILKGALPTFDEIRYATDDVWDVEGVLGVQSDLTLREQ